MVTCSKKEFIERMANALGCPQMANNYCGQLYKIKLTNKYETIFDDLSDAAQQEKMKEKKKKHRKTQHSRRIVSNR